MAEEKKEIIKIPEYQMETRNLTLSKYDYSEVQQNVITLIQEQLKEYMTKDATEAVVRIDSMGDPNPGVRILRPFAQSEPQFTMLKTRLWSKSTTIDGQFRF